MPLYQRLFNPGISSDLVNVALNNERQVDGGRIVRNKTFMSATVGKKKNKGIIHSWQRRTKESYTVLGKVGIAVSSDPLSTREPVIWRDTQALHWNVLRDHHRMQGHGYLLAATL